MKTTILLILGVFSAFTSPGQGSKAQTTTNAELSAQDNTRSQIAVTHKPKAATVSRAGNLQLKKQHLNEGKYCYHPATLSEYTSLNTGIINNFFTKTLILPSPSTAQLLRNQSHPVSVVVVPTNQVESASVPNGEKLFSNEHVTFSSIYPNPSNGGFVFIDYGLSASVRDAKVVLYNVLGTPVSEYILEKEEKKLRISTDALESGFYYYTFFVDGKSLVTRRLVVKH